MTAPLAEANAERLMLIRLAASIGPLRLFELDTRELEYPLEHRRRQAARVQVVARAVVTCEQNGIGVRPVHGGVREAEARDRQTERADDRMVGDAAEREDEIRGASGSQFIVQELTAGVDLAADRLVLGWDATYGVGDPAVDEGETVIGPGVEGPAGEAEPAEHLVEDDARVVAGERAAGPVRTTQAWCQPDDQEPGVGVAE